MHESRLAHPMQILFELPACYQVILNIYRCMETIFIVQIVQYAIEDDKQLFLIVDYALPVDGIQIDHIISLYKRLRLTNGSCPVDFIVTSV